MKDGQTLVDLLSEGCPFPLAVTGLSMMPLLKSERDFVWLQKCESIQRGRILFFRRDNGMFVLHRVRKVRADGTMLLNGDAQSFCETVRPEQALAVVTQIVRRGKVIPWDYPLLRLWDLLWYPTRPVRPWLFRLYGRIQSLWKQKKRRPAEGESANE